MILFRALIRKPAISIAFIFFIAFLIYRSAIYLLGLERANFISWPQNAQSSNEEKRNMISSKQMPLVIVTAYQNMQAMAGRTIRDREEYSGLWGYESEVWRLKDNEKWWKSPVVQVVESGMVVDAIAIPEESRTVTWVKIPALLRAFQKRPNGTAWFWWLDSDAVITNPLRRVRERVLSELAEGVTQDVSDAKPDLVISKDCNGLLNAGSFFIRNTPFAYSLLLTIWHSPLRHTTPKAEQGVLQRLYNGAIPSFRIPKNKIKIVPQREINSFLEGACMPRASKYGKGSLGLSEVQVQILKHNAPSVASKDSAKTGDVGRSRIDLETRDGVWQPGDLVLHIAGCWTRGSHWHGNCHDEFNQAWRERERGWKDVSRLGLSRSM